MFKTNKWKKKIFSLFFIGAVLISVLTSTSLTFENKVWNNMPSVIIFQKKSFNSYDEALKSFMHQQKNNIKRENVIGSLNDATIDDKFNILDKKRLPNYDPSKVLFAYRASNGQLVKDINIAKNSFAKPQDSVSRFTFPGSNKFFRNKEDAESAVSKSFQNQVIAVSKFKLPNNNNVDFYLNASNKNDIQKLKDVLLNRKKTFKNIGLTNPNNNNNPINFSQINDLDPKNPEDLNTLVKLSESNSLRNNGWGIKLINSDNNNDYVINQRKDASSGKNIDFRNPYAVKGLLMNMFGNNGRQTWISNFKNGSDYRYNIRSNSMEFTTDYEKSFQMIDYDRDDNGFDKTDWMSKKMEVKNMVGDLAGSANYSEVHYDTNDWRSSDWIKNSQTVKLIGENQNLKIGEKKVKIQTPSMFLKLKNSIININFKKDNNYYEMLDLNNSYMKFSQTTEDAGGIYYSHKAKFLGLKNIKVWATYTLDVDDSDVKKAKIFYSNSQGKLKKIITYNDKPVFEMKSNYKNETHLYNASNHFIQNNSYLTYNSKMNLIFNSKPNPTLKDLKKILGGFNGFISRNSLNDSLVSLLEVYKQYLNSLNQFVNNENIFTNTNNIKKMILSQEDMLVLSGSTHYKNNIIYNKNFNPSLWGTYLKEGIRDIKDVAGIEMDKKTFAPQVSQVWIYYDSFGNKSLKIEGSDSAEGEYNNSVFDGADLMKENVIKAKKIAIDKEHVFVELGEQETMLVKNQINNIYHFNYENIDRYFRTFKDLKGYLMDMVKKNSYHKKM